MDCIYCGDSDFRESIMEKLCDLDYSTVYLFQDQRYYGRCVVAFRLYHADELYELKPEELNGYMAEVAKTAKAVQQVSGAAKINYAIYGDKMSHVHVHVVPKQKDGDDWGGPFRMDGDSVFLPENERDKLRQALKAALV